MKPILYLFILSIIISCSTEPNDSSLNSGTDPNAWTIPSGNIVTGAFNLFPLVENPSYSKVGEVNISDDALVAVIHFNDEIRVYPYQYIALYESVNDNLHGNNFAITYCPITKSALCYNRTFENETLTLRGSGYLYNNNLIAYDEESETYWSQMLSICIKGKYAEKKIETFNVIETKWNTVKQYFEFADVFTNKSVKSSNPNAIKKLQKNITDGESIYGIVNDRLAIDKQIHIYRYDEFENGSKLYEKQIGSEKIIIVGNKEHHYITSYVKDNTANFSVIPNSFPIIMEDNNGNIWDVFGKAISGPRKGDQLRSPNSFVALGWAWKAFYTDFVFNEN